MTLWGAIFLGPYGLWGAIVARPFLALLLGHLLVIPWSKSHQNRQKSANLGAPLLPSVSTIEVIDSKLAISSVLNWNNNFKKCKVCLLFFQNICVFWTSTSLKAGDPWSRNRHLSRWKNVHPFTKIVHFSPKRGCHPTSPSFWVFRSLLWKRSFGDPPIRHQNRAINSPPHPN